MFLFTAIAHFTKMKADLVRMAPPALPRPELLVTVTGVLEIAAANVNAAKTGVTLRGRPATPLLLRIPLQMIWIGLLAWSAVASG